METIDVTTWEEFVEQLHLLRISADGGYLFRGQRNACWSLDTSLERNHCPGMAIEDYYRLISVIRPQIEAFTEHKWEALPDRQQFSRLAKEYEPLT